MPQDKNKDKSKSSEEKGEPESEKAIFLGFYSPKEVESQCFGECGLDSGMNVILFYLSFEIILNFFRIFEKNNSYAFFFGMTMCIAYIITFFYIYKAKSESDQKRAKFAYKFFMIVFYLDLISCLVDSVIVVWTDPFYFFTFTILGLFLFYTLEIISLIIELYMVWISFCFMVHVDTEKIFLLKGEEDPDLL